MSDLTDRLRGIYRVPITDGLGPTGGGMEPDNPNSYVAKFETTPIMREAADEIDKLTAEVATERDCGQHYREEIGKLRAENERLRIDRDTNFNVARFHAAKAAAQGKRIAELEAEVEEYDFLHHEGGEESVAALQARVKALEAGLAQIRDLEGELNMGNYNDDDVRKLNNAFIESYQIASALVPMKEQNEEGT